MNITYIKQGQDSADKTLRQHQAAAVRLWPQPSCHFYQTYRNHLREPTSHFSEILQK